MTEPRLPRKHRAGLEQLRERTEACELPEGSWQRFEHRRDRRRSWTPLAVATAAVASVAVAVALWPARPRPPAGLVLASSSEGFEAGAEPPGTWTVRSGTAELTWHEGVVRVSVERGTSLSAAADSVVRVARGRARFEVQRSSAMTRVAVSHGHIEVLGTSFTVVQRTDGGDVRVERGRIGFFSRSGERREVVAGETLRWPLPAPEPAPPPPPEEATEPPRLRATGPRAPVEHANVETLMAEIRQLRLQKRYRELATRIEAALRRSLEPTMRESLSYELAELQGLRLGQPARACARLRRHGREFPSGSYAELAAELGAELDCEVNE